MQRIVAVGGGRGGRLLLLLLLAVINGGGCNRGRRSMISDGASQDGCAHLADAHVSHATRKPKPTAQERQGEKKEDQLLVKKGSPRKKVSINWIRKKIEKRSFFYLDSSCCSSCIVLWHSA